MSSAQNSHGGQETTILSLYTTMMHWGAIISPPGYTDEVIFGAGGNPYGTSVTVDQDGNMVEDVEQAVKYRAYCYSCRMGEERTSVNKNREVSQSAYLFLSIMK